MGGIVMKINYWAILVAAVVAFVFSSLYYRPVLLGNVRRVVDPAVHDRGQAIGR
jgi:hypothetical protein